MRNDPAGILRAIAHASMRDRTLIAAWARRGGATSAGGDKVRALLDVVAVLESLGADRRPSKALRDRADVALLMEEAADPDEGW